MTSPTRFTPGHYFTFLRMALGLGFLAAVYGKLHDPSWLSSSKPLEGGLRAFARTATPGYDAFLSGVVAPNAAVFAWLVALGEVAVGIALLIGLLTRWAALGGMFLNLNYMLAKGLLNEVAQRADRMYFAIEIVVFLTVAWQLLAVDNLIFKKRGEQVLTEQAVPRPAGA